MLKKQRIVFDTNALMEAVKKKMDLKSRLMEFELFTIPQVMKELKTLSKGKGKDSKVARLAIKIYGDMKMVPCKGRADEALFLLSKKGFIVATMDKELANKIKNEKKKAVIMSKKHVE